MLKKPASFVLASKASQRSLEATPPVLSSAAALLTAFLSILRECSSVVPHVPTPEVLSYQHSFSIG
jgi:hypothetical protein